jgi:hypothetical protein
MNINCVFIRKSGAMDNEWQMMMAGYEDERMWMGWHGA